MDTDKLDLCRNEQNRPRADENELAKAIGRLLLAPESKEKEEEEEFTKPDMVACVHFEDENGVEETEEVPCHRTILSARCLYFRRALLSGMREANER